MPNNLTNPWLGLKTYSEGQILYGRTEDINALSQDILFNRQTVVYGKSGIGKSSLLNAGVFPILRRSNMFPVNIRLVHNDKQTNYYEQIKKCVEDSLHDLRRDIVDKDGRKQTIDKLHGKKTVLCDAVPNDSGESLWEYFHRHQFWDDEGVEVQPVVVFDQFEELFTLCKDEETRRAFFDQLADLINNVPPSYIYASKEKDGEGNYSEDEEVIDGNEDFILEEDDEEEKVSYNYLRDPKFHIVITLREDFLSYLERYTTNIPLLKHNRYCLRPLSDDQAGIIITDPVPGLISEEVAEEIICKVTDSKPGTFKLGDSISQLEVDSAILSLFLSELYKKKNSNEDTISIELVRANSGNIISSFYETTIQKISERSAEYLEDRLVTEDERRDSIFEDRALKHGVTKEELTYLKEERLIHEFPWNNDGMRIEFMHDILCPVIAERRREREQRRRQEEEEKKRELEIKRREEEAQRRIQEEERKRLEIERKAAEEKRRLLAETQSIRRKNRNRLTFIGLALAFIGIMVGGWLYLWVLDYHEDYGNFTTYKGWPIGLGETLKSEKDKEQLVVYYRLTRKGRLERETSPFYKVDILDAYGCSCTNKFYETPIVRLLDKELNDKKAAAFADLQSRTAYWIYSPGDIGYKEVARCTAYDLDKKELYSIQYYKDKTYASDDENKFIRWAIFNDVDGKQMIVTDNGADRIRQTIKNGLVTSCLFFTELGSPQKNNFNTYGYQYEVDSISKQIQKRYCVDKFGTRIDSTLITYYNYEHGRVQKTSEYEVKHPQQGMIVYQFENFNDTLQFHNGALEYGTIHTLRGSYSKITFQYDNVNRPLLNQKYKNDTLVESRVYTYLPQENKIDSISVLQNDIHFVERYSYPNDSTTEISFWRDGAAYSEWRINEFGDSLFFHKSVALSSLDSLRFHIAYFDKLNRLISNKDGLYSSYTKIMYEKNKKNVKLEYYYDYKGEICKSEWFDYDEYGNRTASAVAGVDGTPVRCPNWSWKGLSYYKMAVLYPFTNKERTIFTATKGLNEFDENSNVSLINGTNLSHIFITDIPYEHIFDSKTCKTSVTLALTQRVKSEFLHPAPFVHILSKSGTFYKTGLRDGDIIVKMNHKTLFPLSAQNLTFSFLKEIANYGGEVVVARAVPEQKKYVLHTYVIPKGKVRAEIHPIELTEAEYKRLYSTLNKNIKL